MQAEAQYRKSLLVPARGVPRAGYDVASAAASWSAVPPAYSAFPGDLLLSTLNIGRLAQDPLHLVIPDRSRLPRSPHGHSCHAADGPALGPLGWVRIHAPTGTDLAPSPGTLCRGEEGLVLPTEHQFQRGDERPMTTINKPVIIVGTGRCGSTVFHRLLAKHSDVMWLSGFCDRYPSRPLWNQRAVTAMDNPVLRRLMERRVQPGECYLFWDRYTYGFSEPCRDLVRTDVTTRVKSQLLAALGKMLTHKRNRLLIKITGWPRIGFLDEIFPDAKFVHILRDGRSVASSLLHVDFWRGWYGPQGWRAGLLSPEDEATWEAYDRSFVALAGLEWRIQMRAIEAARRPARSDALHGDPIRELLRGADGDLPPGARLSPSCRSAPEFEREVERAAIRSMPATAGATI